MKTIRRTLLPALLVALALTAQAETVYLTPHGKTYHQTKTCMALSRATTVYTAERASAESHGLKACGICYRTKSRKQNTANDWAKPTEKQ